jgi:hypothetical protein
MKNKKTNVQDMDEYTVKRWMALIEGVSILCKQAEKQGISPDKIDFKQNHLVSFIDERTEKIKLIH